MRYLLTFDVYGERFIDWWACSDECYNGFENNLRNAIQPSEIRTTEFRSPDFAADYEALFNTSVLRLADPKEEYVKRFVKKRGSSVTCRNPLHKQWKSDIFMEFRKYVDLVQADNLERAGRRNDAANIYEIYGDYKKAQVLRDKASSLTMKSIGVSVDLNKLLKQIRDGGIVAVYKCPHCGGKLEVNKNTRAESLEVCTHCGSKIETIHIADFLRDTLS